jgi:hypothetical protein
MVAFLMVRSRLYFLLDLLVDEITLSKSKNFDSGKKKISFYILQQKYCTKFKNICYC